MEHIRQFFTQPLQPARPAVSGNAAEWHGRLRPHLRVIEFYAWGIWLALAVVTGLTASATIGWLRLGVYHAATAFYILLLFHVLVPRYADRGWFSYAQMTVGVIGVAVSIRLTGIFSESLDVLLALLVIFAAIIGRRRLALYTTFVCGLAMLIAFDFTEAPLAVALNAALRLLLLGALGWLIWGVMERSTRAARQALETSVRATERTARQLEHMKRLHQMAMAVGSSLDLPVVLDLALANTLEALRMDAGLIVLVDEETQRVELAAHAGLPEALVAQTRRMTLRSGEGLLGAVMAGERPVHSTNLATDARTGFREYAEAGFASSIGIPLKSGTRVFGALNVLARTGHAPDVGELDLLSAVGEQIGLAIQRARSYATEQAQRQLAEAFGRVAQALGAEQGLEASLQSILHELQRIVPYSQAAILLREGQTLVRGATEGVAPELTADEIAQGASGQVLAEWETSPVPITSDDLAADPAWRAPEGLAQVRSRAWVPLATPGGTRGVLVVDHGEPYRFGAGDRQVLAAFAQQAVTAVDRAHLAGQAQRRLQHLDVLYQVGRAINSALDLPHVLQTAYEQVAGLTGNLDFFIALYDEPSDEVRFPLYYEKGRAIQRAPRCRGNGLTEYVLRTRTPLLLGDNTGEFEREHQIDLLGTPAPSWLGVPLLKGQQVVGAMAVQDFERANAFDAEDVELFQALAGQVAIAIDNAQYYESVRRNLLETEALFVFNQKARQFAEERAVAQAAAEACLMVLRVDAGQVRLHDGEPPLLTALAGMRAQRAVAPEEWGGSAEPANDSVARVMRERRAQRLERVEALSGGAAAVQSVLCVPILLNARALGAIYVESGAANAYDTRHERFLETLAGQLAVAIESARLREIEQQRTRELAGLFEISQAFGAMDNPQATYAEVTRRLAQVCGTQGAVLLLYDARTNRMTAQEPYYGIPAAIGTFHYRLSRAALRIWNPYRDAAWTVNQPERYGRLVRYGARRFQARQWIAAAMYGRGGLIGVLFLFNRQDHGPFTARDSQLVTVLAQQAALAIENARLVEGERLSRQQVMLINQISRRAGSTLDLDLLVHDLVVQIRQQWGYHSAAVFFVDGEELVLQAMDGESGNPAFYRQPIHAGTIGWVARNRQARRVQYSGVDPLFADPARARNRSQLAVPLLTRGEAIGVLTAMSAQGDQFGENDVVVLQTVADQVAQAIANARLYESERRRATQLATVSQLGREIASVLNLSDLLNRSVQLMRSSFAFNRVRIYLADRAQGVARLAAQAGPVQGGRAPAVPEAESPVGRAMREQRLIVESGPAVDSPWGEATAHIAVPIRSAERVLGALEVEETRPHVFGPDDLFVLQTLADQLTVAISNAELHMEAEQQARIDSATGVYNHGTFLQRMREAVEAARVDGQSLALIMLDIDYFKQYNDTYGHVMGDRVLEATVQAIRQHIKHGDIVGRWGGEEFGVALLRARPEHALQVARRISATLTTIPLVDDEGNDIPKPTVSQGIAVFPEQAASLETLIDVADRMLYVAKKHGRDQVILYLHPPDAEQQYRLPLEESR